MSRIFKAECPHCGTKSVAMEVASYQTLPEHSKTDAFARCGHCGRFVLATFSSTADFGYILSHANDYIQSILTISPSLERRGAPPDTDKKAARYYKQGENSLPGNPDAAVAMFRAALEVAIQNILSEEDQKANLTLYKAIEKAYKEGKITKSMKDWADSIRSLGNDGVHGVEVSEEEANEVKEFTEILFRYLYTLPAAVKRNQDRRESKDGETSSESEEQQVDSKNGTT